MCKESVENEGYPFCDNGEHPSWPMQKMKNHMGLHQVSDIFPSLFLY